MMGTLPMPLPALVRLFDSIRNTSARSTAHQKRNGLLVEADEGFAAKPESLMGDDPVGKIASRVDHGEAGFGGMLVDFHIVRGDQAAKRFGELVSAHLVSGEEHPCELAERRQGERDDLGALKLGLCDGTLTGLVVRHGAGKNIGVGDDLHNRPTQPFYLARKMRRLGPCPAMLIGLAGILVVSATAEAQTVTREQAMRAAVHPVGDPGAMQNWLSRVPVTREFPDDFDAALRGHSGAFVIEMSTISGCVPCGDLWGKLVLLGRRYGWQVRAIGAQEAMTRSGRLGLPWVGHPVAWVRPLADESRTVPVAIGTDHQANLARNLYLSAKMLTGVRAAVGVRALSKFTGIVGIPARAAVQ